MFNKTIIIGRLGCDPVIKTTKSGTSVCTFRIAVNTGWGDSKTTDWYGITVFGKQVEACGKFLSKGSLACVSGSLQLREYESKDGQKRQSLEITADSVTFLNAQTNAEHFDNADKPKTQNNEVQVEFADTLGDIPF